MTTVAPFDLVSANRSKVEDGDLPLKLREIWRGRFENTTGELVETLQEKLEARLQIRSEHLEAVRFSLVPKGISGKRLSGNQRDLLRQVVSAYVTRLPDELAAAEMAKFTDEALKGLTFAWAGGVERGVPHYYRVQGPRLLIEYDNAQRAGNHAHTVWRDPDGDFGMDVLGEHHLEDVRR